MQPIAIEISPESLGTTLLLDTVSGVTLTGSATSQLWESWHQPDFTIKRGADTVSIGHSLGEVTAELDPIWNALSIESNVQGFNLPDGDYFLPNLPSTFEWYGDLTGMTPGSDDQVEVTFGHVDLVFGELIPEEHISVGERVQPGLAYMMLAPEVLADGRQTISNGIDSSLFDDAYAAQQLGVVVDQAWQTWLGLLAQPKAGRELSEIPVDQIDGLIGIDLAEFQRLNPWVTQAVLDNQFASVTQAACVLLGKYDLHTGVIDLAAYSLANPDVQAAIDAGSVFPRTTDGALRKVHSMYAHAVSSAQVSQARLEAAGQSLGTSINESIYQALNGPVDDSRLDWLSRRFDEVLVVDVA